MSRFSAWCAGLVLAVSVVSMSCEPLNAARNDQIVEPGAGRFELVLVQIEDCVYCEVFRRDVMPHYVLSAKAKDLPLRFLDLNTPEARQLQLSEGPVTIVPTLLLVRANREVGRAPGYMGPEGFFQAVDWMLSNAK
jgi:thioredoxin-related protein